MLGWSHFPHRVVEWFTQRKTAREVGEEALAVAHGRVREFRSGVDESRGIDDFVEIREESDEGDKKAVAPVVVEDGVAAKMWVYDARHLE
ncbi:hypothetical protein HK104_004238 [Borealophlyctis nickersoniae]|nr:hypothetical protein HK104_004238 [Borealophlyctis nickersoniae]